MPLSLIPLATRLCGELWRIEVPVPLILQHASDDGGAEGGVVDIGVAGDKDDIDLLPAEAFDLVERYRQEMRHAMLFGCFPISRRGTPSKLTRPLTPSTLPKNMPSFSLNATEPR